jgi:hypothetical protein
MKQPTSVIATTAAFLTFLDARRRRAHASDPRNPPESHEMKCLAQYLDHRFGIHGWAKYVAERVLRKGDYAYYNSLLAQGLKVNHPDVVIYVSPRNAPAKGAAIEVKRQHDSEATEGQLEWGKAFENMCYLFYVAHGFEDARQWIEKYYGKG